MLTPARLGMVSQWGKDQVLRMEGFLNVTLLHFFFPLELGLQVLKSSAKLYLIQNNSHSNLEFKMWFRNASLVESHVNYILLFHLLNELISFQSLVPALHVTLTKDESHVPYPVL